MKPLWIVEWYDGGRVEMNLAHELPRAEMVRMLRAIADGLIDGTLHQVHLECDDNHRCDECRSASTSDTP